jgi:hypothetical protein
MVWPEEFRRNAPAEHNYVPPETDDGSGGSPDENALKGQVREGIGIKEERSPPASDAQAKLETAPVAPALARETEKRGTRLPPSWMPGEALLDWAQRECPSVDVNRETAKFCDYWAGAPGSKGVKTDWDATWRNWMRKAGEGGQRRSPTARDDATMRAVRGILGRD